MVSSQLTLWLRHEQQKAAERWGGSQGDQWTPSCKPMCWMVAIAIVWIVRFTCV